jgi:hypothetical protein
MSGSLCTSVSQISAFCDLTVDSSDESKMSGYILEIIKIVLDCRKVNGGHLFNSCGIKKVLINHCHKLASPIPAIMQISLSAIGLHLPLSEVPGFMLNGLRLRLLCNTFCASKNGYILLWCVKVFCIFVACLL